jgi:hypothetical protein
MLTCAVFPSFQPIAGRLTALQAFALLLQQLPAFPAHTEHTAAASRRRPSLSPAPVAGTSAAALPEASCFERGRRCSVQASWRATQRACLEACGAHKPALGSQHVGLVPRCRLGLYSVHRCVSSLPWEHCSPTLLLCSPPSCLLHPTSWLTPLLVYDTCLCCHTRHAAPRQPWQSSRS